MQDHNEFFWEMIEKSHQQTLADVGEYEVDTHIDCLTTLLAKQSKENLVIFEKVFLQIMDALDRVEIAELSIIIVNNFENIKGKIVFKDYLSTDGFIYFRCWLILQGKAFFDDITKDINAFISGKYSFDIGDSWAEGLLYVSNTANIMRDSHADEYDITDTVSESFPDVIHYDSSEKEWERPLLGGDELQVKYPRLVAEIVKIR